MSENTKTMMITTKHLNENVVTFQLVPVVPGCPYSFAIYDPGLKSLLLFSMQTHDQGTKVNRYDTYGQQVRKKLPNTNHSIPVQDIKYLRKPQEMNIGEMDEIIELVKTLAINPDMLSKFKHLLEEEVEENTVQETPAKPTRRRAAGK
jgi:hypothetical protein